MTKVILNQTVTKLGVAGDVVDVKPGFARNYLIPQSLGVLWTKRAGEQVELRKAAARRKLVADAGKAAEIKASLESSVLLIPVKAGTNGRLFGAVTGANIADAAKAAHNVVIDKRKVELNTPIKALGNSTVKVHILDDVVASVKVNVVSAGK
jgi:large subunit ribosomal protein L9